MEPWRDAVDKNNFPQFSDNDNLHEGPDGHQYGDEGEKYKGRPFDRFCGQTTKTG
jgi:hypothetical protein